MESAPLRIIFAGTPQFAVPPLSALIASEHDIVAIYTQPDRPAGRGRKLQASPIKQLALKHQIPCEQPESFTANTTIEALKNYQADLMVVVAYGLLLPVEILEAPKYGCINIHASLLPRWRGAAPIQRAIQAGDSETGVCIMRMEVGLDTGPILHRLTRSITDADGGESLHNALSELGAKALLEWLPKIHQHDSGQIQDHSQSNYASKLSKAEAEIDWQQTAASIARKIRAFDVWPIAFSWFKDGPLRFFTAQVIPGDETANPGEVIAESASGIAIQSGDHQAVLIDQLQLPSGKKLSAQQILTSRSLLGHQFAHRESH